MLSNLSLYLFIYIKIFCHSSLFLLVHPTVPDTGSCIAIPEALVQNSSLLIVLRSYRHMISVTESVVKHIKSYELP
jgi:hypothetical protein